MTNYRKAQEIINKEFPELMELKEGCEIRIKIRVSINKYGRSDNIKTCSVVKISDEEVWVSSSSFFSETIANYDKSGIQEVFGQPIILQNLLMYLSKFPNNITANNNYIYINLFTKNKEYHLSLDLSKPPQEWSEDKWKEILELLTK